MRLNSLTTYLITKTLNLLIILVKCLYIRTLNDPSLMYSKAAQVLQLTATELHLLRPKIFSPIISNMPTLKYSPRLPRRLVASLLSVASLTR